MNINVSKSIFRSTFRFVSVNQGISSAMKNHVTSTVTFNCNIIENRYLRNQTYLNRCYASLSKIECAGTEQVRLSRLISSYGTNMQMSRKSAELMIKSGQVTLLGTSVTNPNQFISVNEAIGNVKVAGKLLLLDVIKQRSDIQSVTTIKSNDRMSPVENQLIANKRIRVWIANKLPGELVSEHDPQGRPSLLERLSRGGVGRSRSNKSQKVHLKAVGRLDMMTEGLILITNDGGYARELELPQNSIHRTYRARVHGLITPQKLYTLRKGVNIDGTFYKGMKVNLETVRNSRSYGSKERQSQTRVKGGNTNSWLRITCTEGKNRQIKKTLEYVGLKVTRLIRTSFGDYDLNTIPSGMAIEVPYKSLEQQKRKGELEIGLPSRKGKSATDSNKSSNEISQPVQWIRY